ncbi:MAG: PTS transporter subunit EIIC [Lachnospiraceae bacterium]|nr:PTS transporter subunit EIIC [Lachnospiraceae bacterium]
MAKSNKYQDLVNNILDYVGGKDNVVLYTHCITRLRINVKDQGLVNVEAIKNTNGVIGAQWSGEQLQIIIGPDVEKVFNSINEKYGLVEIKAGEEAAKTGKNPVIALFEALAGCLTPLLPLLISVGILKVFTMIANLLGLMETTSQTYIMLNLVADAGLYFLPIFVAATSAKKFNATLGYALLLGAMLISPTFISNVSEGTAMSIFGLPITAASYTGQIFPTIMSVYVLSKVEKLIKKYMPAMVSTFLTPLFAMLIMVPLTYCAIAPIGSVLSNYVTAGIVWLYETFGFFGVGIYAMVSPLLVLTGMHVGMVAYIMQCFGTLGYDPIVMVAGVVNKIVIGFACLAVFLKSKNEDIKGTGLSAGLPAILSGVIEPALYGVLIPKKAALIGTMIGSFVGAAVAGLLKVHLIAFPGSTGVFAIPCFSNIPMFVLAIVIGSVISFVYTYIFYKD